MANFVSKSGIFSAPSEFWAASVGGVWATGSVLFFLLVWQLLTRLRLWILRRRSSTSISPLAASAPPPPPLLGNLLISNDDLGDLMKELEGNNAQDELWEDVIVKKNEFISYRAKCCRQKDGPLKYLSVTTFEKCTAELLRDFYMDNEYRKKWDKTVVDHEQLEMDEIQALEVGRTVKKFPLLTPREYVLAWRLWEGKDNSYYCLIKDCEHPQVPLQKKYVRVGFFRSGWHIKKVPGTDACEIKMIHQEDSGLNIDMARLAFAKGIWNYICKMNAALREYSSWRLANPSSKPMLRIVSVPLEFETPDKNGIIVPDTARDISSSENWRGTSLRMSSKSWIGKGLLLLGGAVCLSRGHSTLATQLAMACFVKKIVNRREAAKQDRDMSPEVPRGRWSPRHSTKYQRFSSSSTDQLSPSRLQIRL